MESFSQKVQSMVMYINEIVKKPHAQEIPGEQMLEEKGSLDLKEFKKYHDHFRKPKYTESVFQIVIFQMRKICLYELKYSDKICYTAITFFRRFFFKNSALEFDPFHVSMVCIYLAAKVEERSDLKPLP